VASFPVQPAKPPSRARSLAVSLWRGTRFATGGAVIGVLGTFQHNALLSIGSWNTVPIGLTFSLLAVAAYSAWTRVAAGMACFFAQAVAVFATSELLTREGSGGDILVPAFARSYVWLAGALVIPLIIAVLPPRWFSKTPRP